VSSADKPQPGLELDLDDIQSGALHPRPSPYVGTYLLLRIDDRQAGRELVRRLHPLIGSGRIAPDPAAAGWITVAFTYNGLATGNPAGARRALGALRRLGAPGGAA
jgi:hypothetical protein